MLLFFFAFSADLEIYVKPVNKSGNHPPTLEPVVQTSSNESAKRLLLILLCFETYQAKVFAKTARQSE
jgi:hypothetical protein